MTAQPTPYPVIIVPGLGNSGAGHWQTLWEEARGDAVRAELGQWDQPKRADWVRALDLAIRDAAARTGGPVVLAAHSLGCLTVAWWAQGAHEAAQFVRGALLVAPPGVEGFDLLASFLPTPAQPLPFASILVASQNDPYLESPKARDLARAWGSHFVDLGGKGHINAQSGLGDWPQGQALLDELLAA